MIDLNMVSLAQKIKLFLSGEPAAKEILVDDCLMSEWVYKLVYLLPSASIDSQKFSREWIDLQFDRVRWFFYCMCLGYFLYLYSQIQLILYDRQEMGKAYYFYIACMILYTAQSLIQEMIQLINEKMAYLNDLSNYVETYQIVQNIVFIGMKLSGNERVNVYFALIMVCLSMIKLNI